MWRARFLRALPGLQLAHPTSRFLFLTLTWKNVAIADLKTSLKASNEAFHRLRKRKEFSTVQGWIRTTEVTRGSDGSAHPHFHVLLMVPSNYFTKNYVPQASWVETWRAALRADYDPQVFVQALKKGDISSDVREVLKYSVKPSDMTADPDWFKELTRQLFKLRFIASGGVLKDVLRESEETDEQLMLLNPDSPEAMKKPEFFASWDRPVQRYICE